jgi:hypothetical protein
VFGAASIKESCSAATNLLPQMSPLAEYFPTIAIDRSLQSSRSNGREIGAPDNFSAACANP